MKDLGLLFKGSVPWLRRLVVGLLPVVLMELANAQPIITNQPTGQTVCVGTDANFTVGATGVEPLVYQWQKSADGLNFADLSGCTTETLTITNVQLVDVAYYRVIITNVEGAVTSSPPRLSLAYPPTISAYGQPTNWPSVSLGVSLANRVILSGTAPFSYQWRLNGVPITGQTKSSITLTNIQVADAGDYDVVVANMCGSTNSRAVALTVDTTFTKITRGRLVTDVEGSVCATWIDYDQDGYLDLFVGNATTSGNVLNSLYHNEGNGTFTKITTNLIGTLSGSAWGTAWGDYDNDGKPDLFVANMQNRRAAQFHNEGGGRFKQVTTGVLVRDPLDSTMVFWGDYDNDGFIDLFVPNGYWSGPQNDRLYHNEGDGEFRITTGAEVGSLVTDGAQNYAFGWVDYDSDGDLDVFVEYTSPTVTTARNFVFCNLLGSPFTKVPLPDFDLVGQSVGQSWADYDNDGFPDLFAPSWYGTNALFRNLQGQGFTNVAAAAGLNLKMSSANSGWADYDNDGWLDLFVGNYQGQANYPGGNALFHNNHNGTFTRVAAGSPAYEGGYACGIAWGDFDNDGFPDLYVACGDGVPQLNLFYRSSLKEYGNSNHWLKVTLEGRASNRLGIGAKVRVLANIGGQPIWQMRTITGQHSWIADKGLLAHFGLGDATNVTTVKIEWPSGIVQELQNVAADQFLTVVESQWYTNASPQFTAATNTPGGLQLSFSEPAAGARYILEASTNLLSWTKLMARASDGGGAQFTDTRATNYARRFYRLQVP